MTEPNQNSSGMFTFVGLPIIAIVVSLIFSFIALFGIINNLPRVGQGDQILIPQEICFVIICFIQIIIPWMISLATFRNPKLRIFSLIWLIIAFIIVNWLFGGFIAFDKAWRRGL